ncbi:MAG: hypothetical protein GTO03_00010, partial [Planctomycetales bacterium]|nr:hypothetical protein [Planctomycetales bacterium]
MQIQIDQPRLVCRLGPHGSNIEDALQPLLDSTTPRSSASPANHLTLNVAKGVVELQDLQGELQGVLADLQLTCQLGAPQASLDMSLAGRVTLPDGHGGSLTARLTCPPSEVAGQPGWTRGRIRWKSHAVPLAAWRPVLRRLLPQARLAGRCSAEAEAEWDLAGPAPRVDVRGTIDGQQWVVDMGPDEAPQPLCLAGLRSQVDARWEGGRLLVRRCLVDSDLAHFTLQGDLDLEGILAGGQSAWRAKHDCRLQGRLNLAQLAAQRPRWLRLRQDTQLTAGEVVLQLTARATPEADHWQGSLVTADLQALSGRRTLQWTRPLEVTLDARRPSQGSGSGRLTCKTDFFKVEAEGSGRSATVAVRGDLDRLAGEMRQLVDLGPLQLAGQVKAGLQLNRPEEGHFTVNAHALLQQFHLKWPGQRPWHEERLTLAADASGLAGPQGLLRLDQASLRLDSAGDQLAVQIRDPVATPLRRATWPVSVRLVGRLQSWLPRGGAWLPLAGWDVTGGVQLEAQAALAADQVVVREARLTLEELQARKGQVQILEPRVLLVTSGAWRAATGVVTSDLTTLDSSALALRADQVSLTLPSAHTRPSLQGTLTLRGDLAGLQPHLADSRSPGATHYAGRLAATLRATSDPATTQAEWEGTIENFAASRPEAPPAGISPRPPAAVRPRGVLRGPSGGGRATVWSEPRIVFSGRGSYDRAADRLALGRLQVQSQALTLEEVQGRIEDVSDGAVLDVAGVYQYDLAAVSRLWLPASDREVQIRGRGSHPFRVRGPLGVTTATPGRPWWTGLDVEAGAAWDQIEAYGIQIGPGDIRARMAEGVVRCQPIEAALNGGRLQVTPVLHATGPRPRLTLAAGRVVDHTRITPQVCASWLQYVAPLLAGATQAEGEFSLDVGRATIPVATPR